MFLSSHFITFIKCTGKGERERVDYDQSKQMQAFYSIKKNVHFIKSFFFPQKCFAQKKKNKLLHLNKLFKQKR